MTDLAHIPTKEPADFYAGDLIQWTKSIANYPASAWTLFYIFQSRGYKTTIEATADGEGYAIRIDPADSHKFPEDLYTWSAFVIDNPVTPTARVTIESGQTKVFPDLAALAGPLDTRTHAEKMLEAIQAVLEQRATTDQQNYTILGRSLTRLTVDELWTWRNRYRTEVRAERAAARAAKGEPRGGQILGQFSNE